MVTQTDIKLWFDQMYLKKGYGYLRPQDAYDIFVTLLAPKEDTKHLDVACGLGLLLKAMHAQCGEVYGIDISSEAIKQSKHYCPEAVLSEGNAERLPYNDETFDTVSCIGSLERMIDRPLVLREQQRVAKPDARFCYMVRNSEHFIWKYILHPFGLENKKGHQDAMNLHQWEKLFESKGFKVLNIYPDHWPYYSIMKFLKPWAKINTSKIKTFPFNINLAYEFIFLLTKA